MIDKITSLNYNKDQGGETMKKRKKMYRRKDRKVFKATAAKTKAINIKAAPMRGGIRL